MVEPTSTNQTIYTTFQILPITIPHTQEKHNHTMITRQELINEINNATLSMPIEAAIDLYSDHPNHTDAIVYHIPTANHVSFSINSHHYQPTTTYSIYNDLDEQITTTSTINNPSEIIPLIQSLSTLQLFLVTYNPTTPDYLNRWSTSTSITLPPIINLSTNQPFTTSSLNYHVYTHASSPINAIINAHSIIHSHTPEPPLQLFNVQSIICPITQKPSFSAEPSTSIPNPIITPQFPPTDHLSQIYILANNELHAIIKASTLLDPIQSFDPTI